MEFLRRRFGDGVERGEDLPQGEWSRAYAFRHAGRELVVRFNADPHTFRLDRLAQRFASPGLPMPAILEVGEVDGAWYAISERAFGDFLEDLPPDRMRAVLPSLLELLDALRTADTSDSSGFGPWDAAGNGNTGTWAEVLLDVVAGTPEASLDTWRRDLARSEVAERAFREGMRELTALAGRCPDRREVVHADLLNRNAFVAGSRVAAVIDWQCAMYGDHLYDLAWFTFWAPWHPGVAAVDLRRQATERWRAAGVDLTDLDLRLRCYELRIGITHLIYNAWRHDHTNLEGTAHRTLQILS